MVYIQVLCLIACAVVVSGKAYEDGGPEVELAGEKLETEHLRIVRDVAADAKVPVDAQVETDAKEAKEVARVERTPKKGVEETDAAEADQIQRVERTPKQKSDQNEPPNPSGRGLAAPPRPTRRPPVPGCASNHGCKW